MSFVAWLMRTSLRYGVHGHIDEFPFLLVYRLHNHDDYDDESHDDTSHDDYDDQRHDDTLHDDDYDDYDDQSHDDTLHSDYHNDSHSDSY